MRVTGGIGKGRKLKVPPGSHVRPTSDKVKQALFNILGEKVKGGAFLDLYAGAGGVGIEALSRGAGKVVFIDDSRDSLQAVRRNVEETGFGERAQVIPHRAETFLRKTNERFDIVFLDPPYSLELEIPLALVSDSEILNPDAIVVGEHFKKQPSPKQAGRLTLYRETQYGDTILAFYKLADESGDPKLK
jgi:16S rRNA (guanine966-N2)-methyltransferase